MSIGGKKYNPCLFRHFEVFERHNTVYALDARTGRQLWDYYDGEVYSSSPTIANGVLYTTSYGDEIYAFSLYDNDDQPGSTGQPNLRTLRPDFGLKASKPVVAPSVH